MKKIKVNDISCGHCKTAITNKLKELDGIGKFEVSVEKKEVSFFGDIDIEIVKKKIGEAGYTPE